MRNYECFCHARLFFENTLCLSCQREVGWCPECHAIQALAQQEDGTYQCLNPACGQFLVKCQNYTEYDVCNRMVLRSDYDNGQHYCDCCQCNKIIPDLSIPGAQARWAALEKAKRRLFYTLDLLKLPHPSPATNAPLPLSFSFMGDAFPEEYGKWTLMDQNAVYTGHLQGNITINVREADDAERERIRLSMGEKQRTLVGHFRHEVGHYYWDMLIKDKDEAAFIDVFGNHESPTYAEAMDHYYANGPAADWEKYYVSPYASMHPWEDFAETFAFYLDIVSVMDTANYLGLCDEKQENTFAETLRQWSQIGVALNELNRDMGLLDFAPEIMQPAVEHKLGYIDALIKAER